MEKEIARIEKESAEPYFWSDTEQAQQVMRRLAENKKVVETWRGIEKKVADIEELTSLKDAEVDEALAVEIAGELKELTDELEHLELELAFSGEYDRRNAIVAIHAGAGGIESQDWAEMLLRMYLRWVEQRGYRAEVLDSTPGEETGIKSAVVEIRGRNVSGYLKSEHGVHRLIRLSPFDADHARHTSFVLVEVLPEVEKDLEIDIPPDDLKVETFRSSGPGGQHMQKTSSAVRITHLPSGLSVVSQNERSQHQNKEIALRILRARLLQAAIVRQQEERDMLKGEHVSAGWGNQIRSYTLHPYKMVKDHRTGYETSNATAVLEGGLDGFMDAYLRHSIGRDDGSQD